MKRNAAGLMTGGLMFAGIALLMGCGGRPGGPALLADAAAGPPTGTIPAGRPNPPDPRRGRQYFLRFNCVGCHGGLAGGAMGPSLRDGAWKFGGTDSMVFNSIRDGRPMGMPSWGDKLSQEQIWDLVAYIKSLRTSQEPTYFFGTERGSAGVPQDTTGS